VTFSRSPEDDPARKKDGKLGRNISRLSFHSLRHSLNLAPRRCVSHALSPEGFAKGDFYKTRQLAVEHDVAPDSRTAIRARYGSKLVLNIPLRAYQYLIGKFPALSALSPTTAFKPRSRYPG